MEVVWYHQCKNEKIIVSPNIQLPLQSQHHSQEVLLPEVAAVPMAVGIPW